MTEQAQPQKPKQIPEYIIRESVFLNHRYIMAGDSNPVIIRTVTRPNVRWEPRNEEACVMLEKMVERLSRDLPKEGPPSAAHIAILHMKRSTYKFRGVPLPEDQYIDEEPQDPVGFVPTVSQPKDAVAALRDASAPRIVNMDGIPSTGMAAPLSDALGGEPPAEAPQTSSEVPAEVPADETPAEVQAEPQLEGDPNADTLAGQQTRRPRKR